VEQWEAGKLPRQSTETEQVEAGVSLPRRLRRLRHDPWELQVILELIQDRLHGTTDAERSPRVERVCHDWISAGRLYRRLYNTASRQGYQLRMRRLPVAPGRSDAVLLVFGLGEKLPDQKE